MIYFISSLPWAFIIMIIAMIVCTCMSSCTSHQANLEDIAEEVVSKDRGVTIEIEPGLKK